MIPYEELRRIAQAFALYEKECYLVGGAVRDLYLGKDPKDYDLATNARPEETEIILRATSATGIYKVGEKFGTIAAQYADGWTVEVTTYRGERYTPGSRKPEVTFCNKLTDDLGRRDFTINAMAYDLLQDKVIDPYDGLKDLASKSIRFVGNPESRIIDDPLRLLRAVRLMCQVYGELAPATFEALQLHASQLSMISAERIRDELIKILVSERAALGLLMLYHSGLLAQFLPEVCALKGVNQTPYHTMDALHHTLVVVHGSQPNLLQRLGALFHDIAKPQTHSVDEAGHHHFYEHEKVGLETTVGIMRRLKFSNADIDYVKLLVRLHMRVNHYDRRWSDGTVRKLMVAAGDTWEDLIMLCSSDQHSDQGPGYENDDDLLSELIMRANGLREKHDELQAKSPLDGYELMAIFGLPAGPWLGDVKEHLAGLVMDGTLAADDYEQALRDAETFMKGKY